jgi:hypothetical protein
MAARQGSRAGRKCPPTPHTSIPGLCGPKVFLAGSQRPPSPTVPTLPCPCARSPPFPGLPRAATNQIHRARSRPGTLFIVSLERLGFFPSLYLTRTPAPFLLWRWRHARAALRLRCPLHFQQLELRTGRRCFALSVHSQRLHSRTEVRVLFFLLMKVSFCGLSVTTGRAPGGGKGRRELRVARSEQWIESLRVGFLGG